jgi:threonine synthase
LARRHRALPAVPPGERQHAGVTLHEGNTPLVPAPRLAEATDPSLHIFLKCEGFNPTGSFKDRGMTLVLTLTGHGLKDPDTALESATRPVSVPARLDTVLSQLGL